MEKNHTYPQAADDDSSDDSFNSAGSTDAEVETTPNHNLDEETQFIQSPPAYRPQPTLCIVRNLFLHAIILLMSPTRFVIKTLRMLNEGNNIPPVV
jgi:hypothetical protein